MHNRKLISSLVVGVFVTTSVAVAQAQQSGTQIAAAGVVSATPIHSDAMAALERTAQRLREAIQSLSQKPPGPARDQAMDDARRALRDTQEAMVKLPAEYRVAGVVVSDAPIAHANPAQNRAFGDSMRELQLAADRLRDAIQEMARQPSGERRNTAIKQAHEALLATQQSMLWVPGYASGTSTGKSQEKTQPKKGASVKPAAGPILVLVPMVVAIDDKLGKGCWARLYDKENFSGNVSVLVGPVEVPSARPATVTGLELGRNYDSVAVGPAATLTVWDNENYRDKTATFKSGQKVANLDNKAGYFEEIKSLKVSCTK